MIKFGRHCGSCLQRVWAESALMTSEQSIKQQLTRHSPPHAAARPRDRCKQKSGPCRADAAVDDDLGTRDIARFIGDEEQNRMRRVPRVAHTSQGYLSVALSD